MPENRFDWPALNDRQPPIGRPEADAIDLAKSPGLLST